MSVGLCTKFRKKPTCECEKMFAFINYAPRAFVANSLGCVACVECYDKRKNYVVSEFRMSWNMSIKLFTPIKYPSS